MLHADRIAQLRAQRGLSQRGLGRKLGKDAQYISKLERGVRQVVTAFQQLTETAGAFQVPAARRVLTFNMGGSFTTSVVMIWGN